MILSKGMILGVMLISFSTLQAATVEWDGFYYDWGEYDSTLTAGQYGTCAYVRWFNSYDSKDNLIWKSDDLCTGYQLEELNLINLELLQIVENRGRSASVFYNLQ